MNQGHVEKPTFYSSISEVLKVGNLSRSPPPCGLRALQEQGGVQCLLHYMSVVWQRPRQASLIWPKSQAMGGKDELHRGRDLEEEGGGGEEANVNFLS